MCLITTPVTCQWFMDWKTKRLSYFGIPFLTTKESLKKGSYKNVFYTGGPLALLVGETALQPPPALLCERDLFYALFITTNRPPE